MRNHGPGVVETALLMLLAAALLPVGCRVIRVSEDTTEPEGAVDFRIENATASTADVSITILAGDADGSTATDGTGKFISEADLASEATVRVPGGTYSDGELRCGEQIVVTASISEDEDSTAIQLGGDGTGTPGFDEGSVGLTGERTLLYAIHYDCAATVVVRIVDDGTGVAGSTSDIGQGEVAVYVAGEVPPVGDLDNADADGDGGATDAGTDGVGSAGDQETVNITVDNRTGSGIALELLVGTGDTEEDDRSDVNVIPLGLANGSVACAQQITIRALIIDADSGADGTEPTLYQITLTGDGTGTAGFDEDTVGPGNARLLLKDTHFRCGDTILVSILDDAAGIDEEEDEVARVGTGTVDIVTAGTP